MSFIHKAALCAGMMASAVAFSADALYSVQSESLTGTTLTDQSLTDEGVIILKPSIPSTATGDVDVLSQCLWSVKVSFVEGQSQFESGKMVCVGPEKEVLESIPQGTFDNFGQCDGGCQHFSVASNSQVQLNLSKPLTFALQPRNERK